MPRPWTPRALGTCVLSIRAFDQLIPKLEHVTASCLIPTLLEWF